MRGAVALAVLVAACASQTAPDEIEQQATEILETEVAPGVRAGGRVLSVAPDADLGTFVAISLGGNDGVRTSQEFDIYRNDQRVGRIKIIRVSPLRAFGRLDAKPGDFPDVQPNDRVFLRLPEGRVLSVKSTAGVGTFVVISVGRKDGVRVGDEYHLSRGGRYAARIQIIRVSEDSSYGRMAGGWGHFALVGDRAWTE